MPSHDFDLSLLGDDVRDAPPSKGKALQDVFLNAVRRSDESVTMFLVNGVMLQGDIVAFDLFCMLLERERQVQRSEEHTSELQSLMRISYAVFCLKKKTTQNTEKNKQSKKV